MLASVQCVSFVSVAAVNCGVATGAVLHTLYAEQVEGAGLFAQR